MINYIYSLTDPRTGKIRYVGKTNNLRIRRKTHCAARGKSAVTRWLLEMKQAGYKPIMTVLEETDDQHWGDCEAKWIEIMRHDGHQLLNRTRGGNGNWRTIEWTPEMREGMRQRFLGRPISPEQRAQISKTLTGKVQSMESVQKRLNTINERRVAKGLTPLALGEDSKARNEVIRKQRKEAKRIAEGRPVKLSPEWKAKISAGMKRYAASRKWVPPTFEVVA